MPLHSPAKKPARLGPYEVLDTIDQGSTATVYRGRNRENGEQVTIKVPSPEIAENEVLFERFQREFRLGSTLNHPNIVRVLGLGEEGSIYYLVLEHVDGQTLQQRIDQAGKLPEREGVEVIVQVARGLHAAHLHGVIHRDVKPESILICADGQAKLADLGLIRDLETDVELTGAGDALGTPTYIAPEQFSAAQVADARSDVYSLGATLYVALTGELPFQARSTAATLKKKLNNELMPPRKLVPALSERVDWVIRRAVQADPQRRHATCLELVQALTGEDTGALADTKRIGARPARTPSRSAERRNSVRYPCTLATVCVMHTSIHAYQQEVQDKWQGKIEDLSVAGMGLWVDRRFELGTLITVLLTNPERGFEQSRQMEVARAERTKQGRWFIAGQFAQPLSKDELRNLLG